jgi:hypothetical protein
MAIQLTDHALWAKGLAARLRVLQASFSDDSPSTRQGYIAEAIENALKQVPSNKRKAWLEALSEEFPAWQSGPAPEPAAKTDPPSPEALLEQLIEVSATLPENTRLEFAKKLAAAGLGAKAQGLADIELTPDLQKILGIEAGEGLAPERAARIFATLADLVLALDKWVWTLWKELPGQKANIRKETDVGKLLGQYLKGSSEVSTQQVVQSLDKTRKLNFGLLFGIGRAGANYATRHNDHFSPEAILDLAKLERGFAAVEVRAWRKYSELANAYGTPQAIEKGIQEAIVKAAEDLINRGRAGI